MAQENRPRFRAAAFATQEALDDLGARAAEAIEALTAELADLHLHMRVFERALVANADDLESISDVLVQSGIIALDPDDAEVEPEEDGDPEAEEQSGADYPYPPNDPSAFNDGGDAPVTVNSTDVSGGETPAQRSARIDAARARRKATVDAQGLKAFEQGNEDPAGQMTDMNDLVDVPEEGVVVDAGRDPFTGERRV